MNNGIALGGIQENSIKTLTSRQEEQIKRLKPFYKIIWVLDSQWLDVTSVRKSQTLVSQGETVFIWPEVIGTKYKDFNDICVKYNLNEINQKMVIDNSFSGMRAELELKRINKSVSKRISEPIT